MKHTLRAAALAAGALLCFSANRAFADLEYVGDDDGGSWFLGYHLQLTNTFDEIHITITNSQDFGTFPSPNYRPAIGPTATFSNFTNANPAFAQVVGSGGTFPITSPVHDFSLASWNQQGTFTNTYAEAAGGDTNDLIFWMHLGTGPQNQLAGVRYKIEVFNNNALVAQGAAYYKRISSNPNVADELAFVEVVPVPAALWTGLPMLGGMILLIRRNRRNVI